MSESSVMVNENLFNKQTVIAICYFLIAGLAFLKVNRKSVLKSPFMLLITAIFFICTGPWGVYNLATTGVSQDATPLSLIKDIGFGIMWAITLGNHVALLHKQLILHDTINPEPLPNQTPSASSNTNQNIPDLESLIAGQTTKLEYAINQLKTELTKRLQIKESLLCISKAVEQASDAICITDANGFATYINKAFLELLGYSIDELNAVGGLFILFATPAIGQEIHSLILNGYSWNGSVEIRTRNGELIQVALSADAIENQTSQVIGIIAIYSNITEQKQAEAAFQNSENRLRLALAAADMAAGEWNIKTRQITWYNNLETVFGIDPETFNGDLKTLLEYTHPDDHQKLTHAVDYAVDEQVDYAIEFRLLCPDGSIRWIESKGQLLYDETGQAVQMLVTVLNITERKKAEELLRKSETTNRALLEAIPDMLFRLNREGFYLGFVSTNTLELPQTTYLLDKHLSEVIPAEVAQLAMDKIEQALNTSTIQTAKYQLLMNDYWHQYEARIVPIKTDEVLAIIRDISNYKRAEEELPKSELQFQKLRNIAWLQHFISN